MQQSDHNYINHEVRIQLLESTCNKILAKLDTMTDSFEKMKDSVNQKIENQNEKIDSQNKSMESNFRWILAAIIIPIVLHWAHVI